MNKKVYIVFVNRHDTEAGNITTMTATLETEQEQLDHMKEISDALIKDGYEQKVKPERGMCAKFQKGTDVWFIGATENTIGERFKLIPDGNKNANV